jgi:hypothetical protein
MNFEVDGGRRGRRDSRLNEGEKNANSNGHDQIGSQGKTPSKFSKKNKTK